MRKIARTLLGGAMVVGLALGAFGNKGVVRASSGNINTALSYDSSTYTLDLNGNSVVIDPGATKSSYCTVYFDKNHDGVADDSNPLTVNGQTELKVTTLVGYSNTSAPYQGDISITMNGALIDYFYGAKGTSLSSQAVVNGDITIKLNAKVSDNFGVRQCLAGGYYASANSINVYVPEGQIRSYIYGAYYPANVGGVHFEMNGSVNETKSSETDNYIAVVEGGNVTGNVYASVGGNKQSICDVYNWNDNSIFVGVNNATVGGNVTYDVVGTILTSDEDLNFAKNATINGDMTVNWKAGKLGTVGASASKKGVFAYDSKIKNLVVNIASGSTAEGTMYPYYKGSIETVKVTVPSGLLKTVTTAMTHPDDNGANAVVPTKYGYMNNKGEVEISGQYTVSENSTFTNLTISKGSTITVASGVTLTVQGQFTNNGAVVNNGTISLAGAATNNGSFTNKNTLKCEQSIVVKGSLTNSGTFNSNMKVNVYGELINSGTWTTKQSTSAAVIVENGGSIANSGTWTQNCQTIIYGTVSNIKEIKFNGKLNLSDSGSLTNALTVNVDNVLELEGTNCSLTNNGTMTVSNTVTLTGATCSLTNKGTLTTASLVKLDGTTSKITNEGTWNADDVIYQGGASQVITNSKNINVNKGIYITGTLRNSGTFKGKYVASGTSTALADIKYVCAINAKIYNSGSWTGDAYVYSYKSYIENTGTWNVEKSSGSATDNMCKLGMSNVFYNKGAGIFVVNGRLTNTDGGTIVSEGSFKLNYSVGVAELGKVYLDKEITFGAGVDKTKVQSSSSNTFYYSVVASYPVGTITSVTYGGAGTNPIEGDTHVYVRSGSTFTVQIAGFSSGYSIGNVKSVYFGSELGTQDSTTKTRFSGKMPAAPTTVTFNFGSGTAVTGISLSPASDVISTLTYGKNYSNIYDLKTITINNDSGSGTVAYSLVGSLPAGLTLSNGVISGTPTKVSQAPTQVKFTVTGKNQTTAEFTLTFNQIEKARPSFTLPTGLSGNANATLAQVTLPSLTNGSFSWPNSSLVINTKCLAGEKFDLYFTPKDTTNYDWSSLGIEGVTWNESQKRLECKVSIKMNPVDPSYSIPTGLSGYKGDTLSTVILPSDANGKFVWKDGFVTLGSSDYYLASYVPNNTAIYKQKDNISIYVTVNERPVDHSTHTWEAKRDAVYHWQQCACGEKKDIYEHSFSSETVVTPATYTSTGTKLVACSCGESKTVEIPKLVCYHTALSDYYHDANSHWKTCLTCNNYRANTSGHVYDKTETIKAATETEKGLEKRTCTACGYYVEVETPVTTHTHNYNLARHDANNHWNECLCGEKNGVTAHSFTNEAITKEATYEEKGIKTISCSCGESRTEEIPKLECGHRTFTAYLHDELYHWKLCKTCNVFRISYGQHNFKSEIIEAPTATKKGLERKTCTTCAYQVDEVIPETSHTHNYSVTNSDETYHWKECQDPNCKNKTDIQTHNFATVVERKEPTATEAGYELLRCSCGREKRNELKTEGCIHEEFGEFVHDNTNHWRVCANCGAETRDFAKHVFDKTEITRKATMSVTGIKKLTCTTCGYYKTETIAKLKPEKVGTKLTDSKTGYKYIVVDPKKIDSADKSTTPAVAFYGSTKKLSGTASIPAAVTIKQINYRVIAISNDALKNQTSLTKITIAKTIKKVGTNAFYGCKKLATVNFAKGTVVKDIGNGAFSGCVKLKEMKLPTTVKTLGSKAFNGCTALTTVSIGKNVAKIGSNCFYNCKAITKLTIATTKLTAKNVGKAAFKNVGTKSISKLTVKVPKSKLKAYKSLLVKKGLSKKAKLTK